MFPSSVETSPLDQAIDFASAVWLDEFSSTVEWPSGWFKNEDGSLYIPNPKQQAFHESTARFKVLFGGRGSGKTTAGAQMALDRVRKGLSGSVLNPDFQNFRYSTWPEFKRWIPWNLVIKDDQRFGEYGFEPRGAFVIHFQNGATVFCKGLRDPDAGRGPNINWLWYDEGGRDRTGLAWKIALAAVRVGYDPSAWVTTTPRGKRHWTAQEFVYNQMSDEVRALLDELGYEGQMHEAFFSSIHDNRANLDPMFYAAMMSAYSGKFREQEIEGKIVDMAEGVVYETFDVDNISTDAEFDPRNGAVEIAFDDGFSTSPRVFLFIQMLDDGRVAVFDEMYHKQHLPADCIEEAKATMVTHWQKHFPHVEEYGEVIDMPLPGTTRKTRWNVRIDIAVGDPSAAQLKASLRRADIVARAPKSEILEDIKLVHKFVTNKQLIVHPRCKNFIGEMSDGYRYPDGGGTDDTKPLKEDDHGPDAIRYWIKKRMRRRQWDDALRETVQDSV